MSTRREQIIEALFTKLQSMSSVASTSVYRTRVTPLSRGESPAIVIEPVSDLADASPIPKVTWELLLRVAVIVRGTATETPDQVADDIIAEAYAKVMSDKWLGGLSMDIIPADVKFELLEGDQAVGAFSMGFKVAYRTAGDDLTAM